MTEGENMQNTATAPGAAQEPGAGIDTTTVDQVADPAKVIQINFDKLKNVDDKKIVEACEKMEDIDNQRTNLNDQASEVRSELKALGIPTAAFNASYARYKMGEKKRAELDSAFAKCCVALDIGYQTELFSGK